MRVTIRKKNLEMTPALAAYVEKKIVTPVQKLLQNVPGGELPILDVELSRTTRHHRKGKVFYAEANLSLKGIMLRAEAEAEDIHAACDLLENELRREVSAFKSKNQTVAKRTARRIKREARIAREA